MKTENSRYMQYIAATTGTMAVTCSALYGTWPSPILPKIAAGDSPLGNITQEERSWIVSSMMLGLILGSTVSGWMVETFGRQRSLLISGIPMLFAWFPIAFATSALIICISRFIVGVAMATAQSSVMLYNGEIADKEIRGRIGSTYNILGLIGEILPLCLGPYLSYKALTLISSVIPLMFLCIFFFMPESPYYLIKIGKPDKAEENLRRLLKNDTSEKVFSEKICAIKTIVDEEMRNKSSLLEFLLNEEYRKSLVISLGVISLSQLSGYTAIRSYMQTIMEYSKDSISPELASTIAGVIQLPLVFLTAALVDKVGRRVLLIISALGCAMSLISIGAYFYIQNVLQIEVDYLSWIPTAGIFLYITMRPIGLGTLTFLLMGELFSTNIKGQAISVSTFTKNVLGFTIAKSFEPMSNAWGLHVMFGLYTLVCLLGAIFVYKLLPETKGKTFAEIRQELNKKKQYVICEQ